MTDHVGVGAAALPITGLPVLLTALSRIPWQANSSPWQPSTCTQDNGVTGRESSGRAQR